MKETMKMMFVLAVVLILFNWAAATITDRIKHPELTETQIMLRSPQTFLWDFKLAPPCPKKLNFHRGS